MPPLDLRRFTRALCVTLGFCSAFPSIQWCPYAWAEIRLECLLEIPAACVATVECGDSCAAPASCDVGECAAAAADPCSGGDAGERNRTWCPGAASGGPGLSGSGLSLSPAPSLAILPTATDDDDGAGAWCGARVDAFVPLPPAKSRARPPARAPPPSRSIA